MPTMTWQFPPNDAGEIEGPNDPGISHFTDQRDINLIRESIQNSLDARSPAGKPIDRVSHHTQQTYYSRVRRYNVWKPLLQPIIATEIGARKITISGE